MKIKIVFGIIAIAFTALFPFMDDLENWSIDQRFIIRGIRKPSDNIIIIGIDGETMEWAKRPFFTFLPIFAELIDSLIKASAKTVFFDISYDTIPDEVIREHVSEVFQKCNSSIESRLLKSLGFALPFRQSLIKSVKSSLRVILGYAYQEARKLKLDRTFISIIPESQLGFLNVEPDSDHRIRRSILMTSDSATNKAYFSSDLSIALNSNSNLSVDSERKIQLSGKPLSGVSETKSAHINYYGTQETFKKISLKDSIIAARENPDEFKRIFAGKIVLLGIWLIEDMKIAPGFGYMPGIEIHANIIENINTDNFLRKPFEISKYKLLLMLLLIYFLLFGFLSTAVASVAHFILAVSWTLASVFLFSNSFLLLWATPCIFFGFSGTINLTYRWIEISREKNRIRNLFGKYVNEKILETLLSYPPDSIIHGQKREVGIMFADIRGFTNYSENRDPEEVVVFLNRYFKIMTDIIYENGGLVDKYLGDGLIAVFNAPVESEFYVESMVDASLKIRKKLSEAFPLKVGIAMNSGIAIMGNIGSEKRLEYTVIGDVVNSTSRLEALNKEYNTDIIATEIIKDSSDKKYQWEFIEEKQIRGKEIPIKIYKLANVQKNS
ncbi:MAG: adenylate/guanylate cyclase domain-containing protein [Candidatus Riflebacteria bacterium]|nr:adenylate/guanylate cyclase domain-containing protein [Candidatus Riflebacteria bacterium]